MFVFGTADDVFTMAVRIEENGLAFYDGAAKKTEDENLTKLFEDLAEMEKGHVSSFKQLRSALSDSLGEAVWDPEGLAQSYLSAAADSHVFTKEAAQERLKTVNSSDEAFEMALRFEKDSVVFFISMKAALPDEKGKAEIDKLIEAELDHIKMLTKAREDYTEKGSATIV
jgi:rubrerythrin